MRRAQSIAAFPVVACLALGTFPRPCLATEPVAGSITFEDARSEAKFRAYAAFLADDTDRFAAELATLRLLQHSGRNYHVRVGGAFRPGLEGQLTMDGRRVIISIGDKGGPFGETTSLNARFAHEFEHARQFDSGELMFVHDAETGRWRASPASYDIDDEVKAWTAQLHVAGSSDLWTTPGSSNPKPTLLRKFAAAKTDAARASVLRQAGYRL